MSEHDQAEAGAAGSEQPGRGILIASVVVGAAWLATAVLAGLHFFGVAYITAQPPLTLAMMAAIAILPALMVFLAGAAAREGVRARHEAKRLADAAADLINPSARAEMSARRLAVAVRGEISALDKALEQTIKKLHDVEASVSRQTHAVNAIATQAKAGAESMISGLEHERAELLRIAEDLNGQAALIGQAISRHTHAISESARIAEAEVRAADEVLESRISSFGAAAALISDRTHALTGAAAASADSALRLETALSAALETLTKATNLTETARQSAEAATMAANSTAGAIRETTARAIEDAKRAADLIRSESANVERDAANALQRLRDAAENARGVAQQARTAVEQSTPRPAPPPPPAKPVKAKSEPPPPPPRIEPAPRVEPPPRPERQPEPRMTTFNRGPAEPAPKPAPAPPPPQAPARTDARFDEPPASPLHPSAPSHNGGAWTWRELLSSIDDEGAGAPQPPQAPPPRGVPAGNGAARTPAQRRREPVDDDPIARLTQAVTEQRGAHPIGAVSVIERAGVQMGEVFTVAALDRIAHRSRNGSQARRKAVKDAVGPAVARLRDHLRKDERARHEAAGFLRSDGARIAELLARGRASMSADATRAFLLLDAAEG